MRSHKIKHAAWLAFTASLATLTPYAAAVVTFGGTGNNYLPGTPAPSGVDKYEGDFGSFTGTPVSSSAMVTATHVYLGATGQFVFNNGTTTATTYNVQMVATLDDLAVWEIAPTDSGTFSLTAPIYTGSSETGSSVVDLGRGLNRGSAVTGGWNWGTVAGTLSWGTNTIASVDTDAQLGTSGAFGGDFLQYDFKNNPTDPNEAIISENDSGGGLFVNDGGVYKLAGVNSLVDSVLDSSGNPLQNSLYDVFGYYTRNSSNQLVQITTHDPMSSYATRISSKLNFVGLADGTISAANAAAFPINNDGQLLVFSNLTTGAITGGAQLSVGYNAAAPTLQIAKNSGASVLSSLTVTPGSDLDITNNQVFINYGSGADPIGTTIIYYIQTGYNGGAWNGKGIISTSAQANPGYGIGYADSADPGNPAGLASGQIELMYTLLGDANLDGKVNGTDFAILATNFNQSVFKWDAGDFNYDGKVNGTDFAFLASNFNQGADRAALESFAAANGLLADLPEPGVASLLLPISYYLTRRRSRRTRV